MLLTVDNSDAIATVKVKLQNLTGNSFRIRFCIINSNLGAIHELTFKGELLSYIKYKCFVFKEKYLIIKNGLLLQITKRIHHFFATKSTTQQ